MMFILGMFIGFFIGCTFILVGSYYKEQEAEKAGVICPVEKNLKGE